MRISSRAMLQRLVTYPWLLPIMPLYNRTADKKSFLNTFYFIRGFPHGYLRDKIRIASYGGLKIAFPYEEDPSFDDVWLRDVYFPYQPQRDDVVMDVGAHMGFFTLKVARQVDEVIAFEPDFHNFRFLLTNIRYNNLSNVRIYNYALGDADHQAFLKIGYGWGRTSITEAKTKQKVEVRTLDSVVNELGVNPTMMKIDTEGYEMRILKGAKLTLINSKPRLAIASYHYPDESKEIVRYLNGMNFHCLAYDVPLTLQKIREKYVYAEPRALQKSHGFIEPTVLATEE
jgi:FkbM family methyltransferase